MSTLERLVNDKLQQWATACELNNHYISPAATSCICLAVVKAGPYAETIRQNVLASRGFLPTIRA